tara:strand:- start:33 stop:377 length:345 start_codon:yes stop_codon:yes gene_type:complete
MTDFFDSEIVREAAREMEELQMKAMQLTLSAPMEGSKEQAREYIDTVRALIQKQQIFYTRMKLSDDPRAKDMARDIEEGAKLLYGWWGTEDVRNLMGLMLSKLDEFEADLEAKG